MNAYRCMTAIRGSSAALGGALVLAWGPYFLSPSSGMTAPIVQTVVFVGLVLATLACPRWKVAAVRVVQRYALNPLVKALYAIGLNPLGLVILETCGRVSGLPRRTPVGNGRVGDSLWVIAEHGMAANYVRNIMADPQVRVRIRRGLRYRWVTGVATVLPADDVLARQRSIVAWHPLRTFNAMNVRLLGVDPMTVHIALSLDVPAGDAVVTADEHHVIDSTSVRVGL